MSINDEFELVPKGALKDLKKEIELLKQGKSGNSLDVEELQKQISLLRKSVDSMFDLFKKAAEEIKLEDRDQNLLEEKLKPLTSKVETLNEQNQKIAKALVTVSNMVQENMKKFEDEKKKTSVNAPHVEAATPDISSGMPHSGDASFSSVPSMPPPPNMGSPINAPSGLNAAPLPKPSMPNNGNMGIPPPPPPKKKGLF